MRMVRVARTIRPMVLRATRIIPPVRPSAAISAWYRAELDALIADMHASVIYWLRASYKANPPVLAQDELPSQALWRAMHKLRRRWQKQFDEAAPKLAKHFAKKAENRSSARLKTILNEAGMTVKFTMTRAQADVMRATMHEQVSLIRSIPQKHFTEIEGLVMRSVQAGRDLGPLADALQKQYGSTKKRAALIARDQNNKATATMTMARQVEMGIEEAIWVHSHAGKVPRPTHRANDGKRYDVKRGWYDPDADGRGRGRYIHPGELINCRCVSRSIIPGFST